MKLSFFRPEILAGFLAGLAIPLMWDGHSAAAPDNALRTIPVAENTAARRSGDFGDSLASGRVEHNSLRHSRFPYGLLRTCAIYLDVRKAAADSAEAARLVKLAEQTGDSQLRDVILNGLAAGNPEWALEHCAHLRYGDYLCVREALRTLYARDPAAAAAKWYPRLPESARERIIQGIECTAAARAGDLARLDRYQEPRGSGGTREGFLVQLIANHPEYIPELTRRKQFLRIMNDFSEYGPTTVDILRAASSVLAPDEFLKWSADHTSKNMREALLIAGGSMEPADLIARCKKIAGSDLNMEVTLATSLADDLARKAPQVGLKWLAELEAGAGGQTRSEVIDATRAFAAAWYRAQPAEAMAAALAAGGDTVMAEQIVREAFIVVPEAAAGLQKAEAITDPRLKELALASVVGNCQRITPEEALPVLARITNAQALKYTVPHVFGNWAADDPAAAANWLKANTPGYAASAMETVFISWVSQDAPAAAGWLRDLPAGPARDTAANQLARRIAHNDPGGALSWAAEVGGDSLRQECLRSVLAAQKNAGIDTKAVIERTTLSAPVREELKSLLSP